LYRQHVISVLYLAYQGGSMHNRLYIIKLENGKYGICDLCQRARVFANDGTELYSSFLLASGFTKETATRFMNSLIRVED